MTKFQLLIMPVVLMTTFLYAGPARADLSVVAKAAGVPIPNPVSVSTLDYTDIYTFIQDSDLPCVDETPCGTTFQWEIISIWWNSGTSNNLADSGWSNYWEDTTDHLADTGNLSGVECSVAASTQKITKLACTFNAAGSWAVKLRVRATLPDTTVLTTTYDPVTFHHVLGTGMNLVVHRPMYPSVGGAPSYVPYAGGTPTYEPFESTAVVSPANSGDSRLGAGIRCSTSYTDYVDSIQIDLSLPTPATGTHYIIYSSDENLLVWDSNTGGSELLSGNVSSPLSITANPTTYTYYVQWTGFYPTSYYSTLTLARVDGSNSVLEYISYTFHEFSGIIIGIGGLNETPTTQKNRGIWQIGDRLYNEGFDVWLYNHGQIQNDFLGQIAGPGDAYTKISNEITNQGVTTVAGYGFSMGGGATFDLLSYVGQQIPSAGLTICGYIDAQNNNGGALGVPIEHSPPGMLETLNWYGWKKTLTHPDRPDALAGHPDLSLDATNYFIANLSHDDMESKNPTMVNTMVGAFDGIYP